MKIEYLSKSIIPSRSANSIHVMKMCQAFAGLGHDVTLHALRGSESVDDDFAHYGVSPGFNLRKHDERDLVVTRWLAQLQKVLPFARIGPARQALFGRNLARREFREAPDLIYARHLFWLLGASIGGRPFIFESHKPPDNRVQLMAERQLFKRPGFCRLVVISSKLKSLYLERFPELPAEKILVSHDGADSPDLQTTPRIARSAERLQVGYVGHLYPGRGTDLIRAIAAQTPDADFHLVGGTEEDIAALKNRVLPDNLSIHGFVSPGEIGGFYASFDAFLAPYQKKVAVHGGAGDTASFMSPLKIFEYMSWGKSILASDLPVLREVLDDGHTALLLAPENAEAWSQALRSLIENPQKARNLGAAARDEFVRNYAWSTRAEKILCSIE
jgi:glycosyltransferase involved in cell wall biosynthesis